MFTHRRYRRTALAGAILFGAVAAAPATQLHAQSGRAFTPADWYRVTTVSDPAMSPDGNRIAFTVTTVVEKDNKRHSEVWVVPTSGGEPVRYTSPSTESSSPSWSHDGKYLFFQSRRAGGEGSRWALRMDAPSGEAFQLKDYPSGSIPRSGEFAVYTDPAPRDSSADSTRSNDPFERMQATARPPYGSVTRPIAAARFDGRHVVDLGYKRNGPGYVPNPREARQYRPSQLWMQRFNGGEKTRLTSTVYSHRNATVSPDGRRIAFIADSKLRPDSVVQAENDSLSMLPYDAAREAEPRNDSDIFILDVASPNAAPRRIEIMGSERSLAWSPDGRRIAFVHSPARAQQSELAVVDVSSGNVTKLGNGWQFEPQSFEWLSNDAFAVSAAIGGSTHLFRVNARNGSRTSVLDGRRRLSGFSFDDRKSKVAYVSTSVNKPTELYVANADGSGERKLSAFNDSLNREIAWADAERFTYESVGGLEIEGWLMKPYGYQPGTKYPLVLYIHGGPHSAYGENWFDEFQNIAGAGMWVLYTNPRGSSGYGSEFTYTTRGRWGLEDYEDIMKSVDIAVMRPDVDSTKMGVTGGSYGGFMTAWITTRTDRFKAAQADRMISNWWSWYGSSDAQGLTEFEFYGKPWENPALYDTLAPIRYVDQVNTPTLIVQSEEDHRTPMTDAEQWFAALKKRDVPVEFVRYPRSTHDLSRTGEPWLLVDRLGRLRQWFGYWLKDEAADGTPRVTASGGR